VNAARALALALVGAAAFAADGDAFALTVAGEIVHADTITVRRDRVVLSVQDATAVPRMVGGTMMLENGQARAYGGAVTGSGAIALADGDQEWRIGLKGLDLGAMLRALDAGDDGVGATFDGWAEVFLPGGEIAAATGRGELLLREADLLRFGPLANLLIGDPSGQVHADTAEVRFDLADGRIRLRATRIVSPAAEVHVRGTIGLDGTLDLVVVPYPRFKTVKSVPGIGGVAAWLLGAASSRVARASVRGDIADPVVTLNPFAE